MRGAFYLDTVRYLKAVETVLIFLLAPCVSIGSGDNISMKRYPADTFMSQFC